MAQAPIMPLATDALIGDTLHLNAEEFGAYCLLLFATWRNNGKPIRNDDVILSRICRTPINRWRSKLKHMLLPFFDISDGYLRQKRLEKEWMRIEHLSQIRSEAGKQGGRPKPLTTHNTAKANGSYLPNRVKSDPKPIPKEEDSDSDKSESDELPLVDPVKALWDRGKALLRAANVPEAKIGGLIGGWRKEFGNTATMAAIAAAEKISASDPVSYVAACLGRSRTSRGASGGVTPMGSPGFG